MKEVKNLLSKNKVVFCGALRYAPNQTSDATAAKLASYLKTDFINLTNVPGLYSSNPAKNKNAKFISEISWEDFKKKAMSIKYKPGQHFVLDQTASALIKKHKKYHKASVFGKLTTTLQYFLILALILNINIKNILITLIVIFSIITIIGYFKERWLKS